MKGYVPSVLQFCNFALTKFKEWNKAKHNDSELLLMLRKRLKQARTHTCGKGGAKLRNFTKWGANLLALWSSPVQNANYCTNIIYC